jgi:hypothetical protein
VLEVDRLRHVRVRVELVAAEDVLVGLGGGEHDDRDAPQLLVALDLLQHLAAVPPGEVEVEQDEVGQDDVLVLALLAEVGERLRAVGHHGEPVAEFVLLERLLRHQDVARIVLDEQHLDRALAVGWRGHAFSSWSSSEPCSEGSSDAAAMTGSMNLMAVPPV